MGHFSYNIFLLTFLVSWLDAIFLLFVYRSHLSNLCLIKTLHFYKYFP